MLFKDTPTQFVPRLAVVLPAPKDRLETTVNLLTKYNNQDHFAYERGDTWHLGLDSHASLSVDPKGETAFIDRHGKKEVFRVNGSWTDVIRNFVSEHSEQHDGKMFGQVGFNYGAHVRGQFYTPGKWPILNIMVPITEITLEPEQIIIQGYNEQQLSEVCKFLKSTLTTSFPARNPRPVNTQRHEEEYKTLVSSALSEIGAAAYTNVIVSRP